MECYQCSVDFAADFAMCQRCFLRYADLINWSVARLRHIHKIEKSWTQARIQKAIDVLDIALGDTDPPNIDYEEDPMIHAMHILIGIEGIIDEWEDG